MKISAPVRCFQAMAKASGFASIGYVVDYTFQLVDMFWLAKLGPVVPTALTIISVYLFFSLALNEIVGSGSVSVISQTIGSRDVTAARRKILQVLQLKLGFALGLMVPLFVIVINLDAVFVGKNIDVQTHVWAYAGVIWASLIVIPVYTTLLTVMRSANLGGMATTISLVALVANFGITPFLVFGWLGAPELGVAGGAMGAVIAQLITLGLSVICLNRYRPDLLPRVMRLPKPDWKLHRKIIDIGWPVGFTLLIFQVEAIILVACINSYPLAQSDGFGVGLRLIAAVFSINVGVAVGAGVITGNYIGGGNAGPLKKATVMFMAGVALVSAVIALSAEYWTRILVSQFVQDPVAISFATTFLQFALVANIAFACSHVLIGVFEGRGTTKPILMSMVASFVLIEFPLLLWLNHILPFQPEPLWMSMIAAYIAGFSALGLYFWRQG